MPVTSPLPAPSLTNGGAPPATRLADRALLRASGAGTAEFLQGLLTQDVVGALHTGTGAPVWAGLLSPQGKVLFDLLLWPAPDALDGAVSAQGADEGAVLLDVEATRAEALLRKLTLYRLRRPLTLAVDDRFAVHWAAEVAPQDEGKVSARRFVDPRLAALGWRWLMPVGSGATTAACHAHADARWRAHRLSLGVTEGVAELGDGQTLCLEANARELNGVSFTKGCYVGQENTARMHHRGKINRRLVVVPDALDVGRDAAARYPELGCKVVLARRDDPAWGLLPDWARGEV